MMKKTVSYIVPILVLILFITIMTSGGILKKPFGKSDDVASCIETLKKDVINEDWEQAKTDVQHLKAAWKTVEKRVQFSVERDEMNIIDINIARIEGAISIGDKSSAIIELSEIMEHWNALEK